MTSARSEHRYYPSRFSKNYKDPVRRLKRKLRDLAKPVILPRLVKRRFRGYCVGHFKTGTTSMAGIFKGHYRAGHEADNLRMSDVAIDYARGHITAQQMNRYIRKRDQREWLEFDSSAYNWFFMEVYLAEFQDAKFVLTIRDPYSQIVSCINYQRAIPQTIGGETVREWLKASEPEKYLALRTHAALNSESEKLSRDWFLEDLDTAFWWWAKYNQRVIDTIPESKLLVVRTDKIASSLDEIAEFFEVPRHTLDATSSHLRRSIGAANPWSGMDADYVKEKCRPHCRILLQKFFPEHPVMRG